MRTFSPWANVLIVCTGVEKSTTSRRLRRFSGSAVFMNSTTMFWPCVRMSMPVLESERSTTMRPSPPRPRRKSMSRIAWRESPRPSAKWATFALAVGASEVSVTTRALPSTTASCATDRRRLSTMRVLSDPCTMFMLRSSPSPMSCELRPRLLTAPGKSKAMRAGLATVKFGGMPVSGCFICTRTVTLPPICVTLNDSMLFACARAAPVPASQRPTANSPVRRRAAIVCLIIGLSPPVAASWRVRPSLHRRPARVLSA